jgi:hypothetical protein
MFKEELSPEAAGDAAGEGAIDRATVSYGIAVSRLLRGERDDAVTRFRDIVSGTPWPAFAHLAAEAELARPGVVAPHN